MCLGALSARRLVPGRRGLLPLRVRARLWGRQLPAGPGRVPEPAVRARGRVPRPGQRVSCGSGRPRPRGAGAEEAARQSRAGGGGWRLRARSAGPAPRSAPGSGATVRTRATRARAASRRYWSASRRPARTTRPASKASGASAASAGQVRVRLRARACVSACACVRARARAPVGPRGRPRGVRRAPLPSRCVCDCGFSERHFCGDLQNRANRSSCSEHCREEGRGEMPVKPWHVRRAP